VCDTVLERPREKINGREGRNEDVAEEEENAVACDCALDAISENLAPKIGGGSVLTVN
jgi:hypothetical protein